MQIELVFMELDFSKLGLKAGLEVHQQLETGKLFCRCLSLLREEKPDIVFRRKMRIAASEFGEFDAAAGPKGLPPFGIPSGNPRIRTGGITPDFQGQSP